jgi:histone deacetylase 1/2
VCFKEGHNAANCWHRFDADYVPDEKNANAVAHVYGVASNWYTDTGAADHITSELDKLVIHDKYNGDDQICTASGAGMNIDHIGKAIVSTPNCNLKLNNVLHVPNAKRNLVSVHRLATDNRAFLEFHPNFFLIKDQATKRTLLEGKCRGGLYLLPTFESRREAHSAIKPYMARWHSRLGHPALPIVNRVISENNLPCVREDHRDMVCDACQQAKSHQLPYPKSSSISHSPLDLIFSDVWALAPDSVGRNKYYVSFIDDHSKFVWLYTLRYKSEVFEKFHEFQKLVERRFNKKIVAVQTHWGGEYEKLNLFFRKVGITHLVSCPHAHQQNGAAERKHCHIVEVGLSLLAHSSMPLKYWDQAFLAVVYLIIRTPAKILRHSSPLETLFHEKPDYSMFRVFGCACWPNLGPYNARNLLSGLNDVSSWDIAPCTKDLSAWMFLLVASTSLVMLFLMSKFFPLLNFMLMLALVFILKLSFFLLLFLMLLLFLGVLRYLQQMCLIVHLTLLLTLVKIWRKIKL